jgi:hypothetical protein
MEKGHEPIVLEKKQMQVGFKDQKIFNCSHNKMSELKWK